jgi:hypothetical protein
MVSYEQLGQFEDAARAATGYACFGVPIDGDALLAAWRTGGVTGYWLERLAAIDRLGPSALPMAHYNYAVALTFLGRCDEAMAHLTALADNDRAAWSSWPSSRRSRRDRADFDDLLRRIGALVRPWLQHCICSRDGRRHAGPTARRTTDPAAARPRSASFIGRAATTA